MPSGTYYLDGSTLSTSTAIYSDSDLTTKAADGFYSDGNITREQSSGLLLPSQPCAECEINCGGPVFLSGTGTESSPASSPTINTGVEKYMMNFDSETGLGAVVIRFSPGSIPQGFRVKFDGNVYNAVSTQNFGWKNRGGSPPQKYIWLGDEASNCGLRDLSANKFYRFDEFVYSDGVFEDTGNTEPSGSGSVAITNNDIYTTAGDPGECVMVFPKTSNDVTNVLIEVFCVCLNGQFDVSMECPVVLPSFPSGSTQVNLSASCNDTLTETSYYVHVNGAGGVLGLYDFVFSDSNGATPLADGWYLTGSMSTSYDAIEVTDGVVTDTDACTSGLYVAVRCIDGISQIIFSPTQLTLGETVSIVGIDCPHYIEGVSIEAPTAILDSVIGGTCATNCTLLELTNNSGSTSVVSFTDCSGAGDTVSLQDGEMTRICARSYSPIANPNISYEIISCDCASLNKYTVEACGGTSGTSYVVATPDTLSVGDLVLLDVTAPNNDCYYHVTGTSASAVDYYVMSHRNDIDCSDLCVSYQIENTSGSLQTVTYTACDGGEGGINLNNGNITIICALVGTLTAPLCTVTYQGCDC